MYPFTLFQLAIIMWPSSSPRKPGVWPLCELCPVFSLQPQYWKINPNLIKQSILSSCLCWAVKSLCFQRNSALQKMCSKFSSQPSAGAEASPDLAPGSDLKWSLCIIQLCIHLEGILFFHLSPRMLTVQLKLFLTKNISQYLKTCLTFFLPCLNHITHSPFFFVKMKLTILMFIFHFCMSGDSSTYLLEFLFDIKLKVWHCTFLFVIVVITHSFWRQNSHLIPQAELRVIHLSSCPEW